ncbi:hypothetical protein SLS63_013961 [Diaporthe eres]|uniref:Uncharacterized protein n=1 Tax=Diaporthe eres TaxID=83184 RepID=A0ABR1NM05_DIAER
MPDTRSALHRMKTPQAAFEERYAAASVSFDQALHGHHAAESREEADRAARYREDILRHSAELIQLEQDHQATLDAKNKEFEHQRRLAIEDLCRRLILAVGPDLIQKALRKLTKNPSDATSSTLTPANQPTPPATEPEPEVVSPAEHPARSPPASSERPRKRRTDAEPESHGRRKRTAPAGRKISSMWYDEIYKEGHAETKHMIVEHPKGKLAEENNAVARNAFRSQDDTAASGSRHGRRRGGDIVSPTPGQVYLCYWNTAKKSWPVLLLPTANLKDVGVPETLKSLNLLKDLPPCYRQDTTTNTLEWKEGFEDGGAKVAQRWFPVMFFDDGLKFPARSDVAWVPAKDLDVLDIESAAASDVPHIRSVRAYLRARAPIPSEADPSREMDAHVGMACS